MNSDCCIFQESLEENKEGDADRETTLGQKQKRKANTDGEDYGNKKPRQDDDSMENSK